MDFTTLQIIWLVCGVIAASIYHNKGRSGAAGFLAGVLLGPIGVILALASGRNEKGLERRAVNSGELRKCPHCAELIKTDAKVCRYCGRDVEPIPASYGAPPPGPTPMQ